MTLALPGMTWVVASPFLVLWLASPVVAWWISRPVSTQVPGLNVDQEAFLRTAARRTRSSSCPSISTAPGHAS